MRENFGAGIKNDSIEKLLSENSLKFHATLETLFKARRLDLTSF